MNLLEHSPVHHGVAVRVWRWCGAWRHLLRPRPKLQTRDRKERLSTSLTMSTPQNPHELLTTPSNNRDSLLRRSWHLMADRLSPFSPQALASLPNVSRPGKYLRADGIPDTSRNVVSNDENGNNSNGDGGDQRPTVRDYHSINNLPPQVRVPKKIPTSVKVEGKVWFANERSKSVFVLCPDVYSLYRY